MLDRLRDTRDRTAFLLLPACDYRLQDRHARAIPGAEILDWRAEFLKGVRTGQRFLGITPASELDGLRRRCASCAAPALVVINTEYPLSYFSHADREAFSRGLWGDFPYSPTVLIYSMLDCAEFLPRDAARWEASGRLLRPRRAEPQG